MILVIDNYDSFTYNLVQYLGELKGEMQVHRNDQISIDQIRELKPERILVSPGPCSPRESSIGLSGFHRNPSDHVNRRVEFEQREGMFRTHRGRWDVSASSGTATEVQWRMEFDTGMPHLAHMVNPVIARAFLDLAVELIGPAMGVSERDRLVMPMRCRNRPR